MSIPTLNEKQDYGGSVSTLDRRQYIDFGGLYRATYTLGMARALQKRSDKFTRRPEAARALFDFFDSVSHSPGYFKWQPVGDKKARLWTVDSESLELSEDSYGRNTVSVKLTEYVAIGSGV